MSDVGRREIDAITKIARNVRNGQNAQDVQDRGNYRACRVTYDGDHMCFSPLFKGSWDECLNIVNGSDFDCVILDSRDRVWDVGGTCFR